MQIRSSILTKTCSIFLKLLPQILTTEDRDDKVLYKSRKNLTFKLRKLEHHKPLELEEFWIVNKSGDLLRVILMQVGFQLIKPHYQ